MATNGICYSFKQEVLQGLHCFNASQSAVACSNTSGTNLLTGLVSTLALAVGMAATGAGIPSSTIIIGFPTATEVELSAETTAGVTSASFAADEFYLALIAATPSRTYGPSQTNYGTGSGAGSTSNLGTDEVSGTGYTAGGILLTNVTPSLPDGQTAIGTFSPSPSLTGATLSTSAGLIYNASTRGGAASGGAVSGRAVGVYDFGGVQSVSAGTITFIMPSATATTALIQLA
jgi:hypothetical protein